MPYGYEWTSRWLISMYFIDYDEEAEDSSIENDGADLYYKDENGLVEVVVRTCVT